MWGENPEAAIALGLKADLLKYSSVLLSGVFSALAGVNLALENINMFVEDMTSGRGFIALAAIFCGKGTPVGVAISAFLFGVADAVQMRLQGYGIPGNFVQMIPFLFIVIVLTVVGIIKRRKSLRRSDTFD